MISQETLNNVHNGILTNEQLDEAINHYTTLANHLQCHVNHNDTFRVVFNNVKHTLNVLLKYKTKRNQLSS